MSNYIRELQKQGQTVWEAAKKIEANHKKDGIEYTYSQILQEALAELELLDKPV